MINYLKDIKKETLIGQLPDIINNNNQSIRNEFNWIFDSSLNRLTKSVYAPTGSVKAHFGEFTNLACEYFTVKNVDSLAASIQDSVESIINKTLNVSSMQTVMAALTNIANSSFIDPELYDISALCNVSTLIVNHNVLNNRFVNPEFEDDTQHDFKHDAASIVYEKDNNLYISVKDKLDQTSQMIVNTEQLLYDTSNDLYNNINTLSHNVNTSINEMNALLAEELDTINEMQTDVSNLNSSFIDLNNNVHTYDNAINRLNSSVNFIDVNIQYISAELKETTLRNINYASEIWQEDQNIYIDEAHENIYSFCDFHDFDLSNDNYKIWINLKKIENYKHTPVYTLYFKRMQINPGNNYSLIFSYNNIEIADVENERRVLWNKGRKLNIAEEIESQKDICEIIIKLVFDSNDYDRPIALIDYNIYQFARNN